MLSHVIRECESVNQIVMNNTKSKLSQYADGTALYFRDDFTSLTYVMDILRWYATSSGLGINKEKTKVIKIGMASDRSIPWERRLGLPCFHLFDVLWMHYTVYHLGEIMDNNRSIKLPF